MPLLLVGEFKSEFVAPACAVVWLILLRLRATSAPRPRPKVARSAHLVSAVAVLVALADIIENARRATQHLLVDGDPAVYGMTGKWIAEHGTLNITLHPQWLGNDQTVNYMTNGFFMRPDGHHLYPQFFHLLPALLAVANWVAGARGLLHANMVIGGFALLAVYAFASRLMRPIWALAAMVTLAMTLPQLFFGEDTFSEIPSQLLVFAGLAMLYTSIQTTRTTSTSPAKAVPRGTIRRRLGASAGRGASAGGGAGRAGLLAGLTLGASTMARVDAFLYIPVVLAAVFALVLTVPRDDPRRAERVRLAVGVTCGLAVTAAIAAADAAFGSPAYADSVSHQLIALAVVTAVLLAAGVAVLFREPVERFATRVGSLLSRAAAPIGALVCVAFAFAWLVRPLVQRTHSTGVFDVSSTIASLQRNEHVAIDPTRHYNEMSLRWISWYVGPVTLAVAIIGFGYLTYRVLRGRDLHTLPFLLLAGAATAVYTYNPEIAPVQYWATRRFLPVTFPAVCVLTFLLVDRMWSASTRQVAARRTAPAPAASRSLLIAVGGGAIAVVVAVIAVATPAYLLRGQRLVRAYVPVLDAVHRTCAALQPSDVVLLVGKSARTNGFVQTIETYCGNMAAVAGVSTEPADIRRMAAAAAATGHQLVLVSDQTQPTDYSGAPLGYTLDRVVANITFDTEALSLSHRPDADFKVQLQIFLGTPTG